LKGSPGKGETEEALPLSHGPPFPFPPGNGSSYGYFERRTQWAGKKNLSSETLRPLPRCPDAFVNASFSKVKGGPMTFPGTRSSPCGRITPAFRHYRERDFEPRCWKKSKTSKCGRSHILRARTLPSSRPLAVVALPPGRGDGPLTSSPF